MKTTDLIFTRVFYNYTTLGTDKVVSCACNQGRWGK